MLPCVFIFIYLHFTHPFHPFLPLLSSLVCTHTNSLSSALHTYRNTPRWHIRIERVWDIEPERTREEGGKEMRERVVEHRDISQVWQWSRISFPAPSVVDSELNTEHTHCRAQGQTQPPHWEEPCSQPEDLIDCRTGLKANITPPSGPDAAWRAVQITNLGWEHIQPELLPLDFCGSTALLWRHVTDRCSINI